MEGHTCRGLQAPPWYFDVPLVQGEGEHRNKKMKRQRWRHAEHKMMTDHPRASEQERERERERGGRGNSWQMLSPERKPWSRLCVCLCVCVCVCVAPAAGTPRLHLELGGPCQCKRAAANDPRDTRDTDITWAKPKQDESGQIDCIRISASYMSRRWWESALVCVRGPYRWEVNTERKTRTSLSPEGKHTMFWWWQKCCLSVCVWLGRETKSRLISDTLSAPVSWESVLFSLALLLSLSSSLAFSLSLSLSRYLAFSLSLFLSCFLSLSLTLSLALSLLLSLSLTLPLSCGLSLPLSLVLFSSLFCSDKLKLKSLLVWNAQFILAKQNKKSYWWFQLSHSSSLSEHTHTHTHTLIHTHTHACMSHRLQVTSRG